MYKYEEIKEDLIKLSLFGKFDVIVQGNNCFCVQGAGIAPQFVKAFNTDKFYKENKEFIGDINKLGTIDYQILLRDQKGHVEWANCDLEEFQEGDLIVVNAYTQYGFGNNYTNGSLQPLDYEALTLCMRKINHIFKGKHIGLPKIGCGLAGGDWNTVRTIIQKELKDCQVTIVIFE